MCGPEDEKNRGDRVYKDRTLILKSHRKLWVFAEPDVFFQCDIEILVLPRHAGFSMGHVKIQRLCPESGIGAPLQTTLLLLRSRPSPPKLRTGKTGVLRKDGGAAIKLKKRTTRLGPQGRTLKYTPKEVVFRGTPISAMETGRGLSTPLGGRLKSLALWTRIFTHESMGTGLHGSPRTGGRRPLTDGVL